MLIRLPHTHISLTQPGTESTHVLISTNDATQPVPVNPNQNPTDLPGSCTPIRHRIGLRTPLP